MRGDAAAPAMGIFFILAGAAFLGDALGLWDLRPGILWPLLLVGVGVALLLGSRTDHHSE